MAKSKIIFILLVLVIIASNAWWAYRSLDTGITLTHMGVALDDNKQALRQALAILPVVAQPGVTREKVIETARLPSDTFEPFEKDGFIWIGKIGLKFNNRGQLVEAARAWSPP